MSSVPTHVVRHHGRWYLTVASSGVPEPASVDDVCALLGADGPATPPTTPDGAGDRRPVREAWAWSAALVDGGLRWEDLDGRSRQLGVDEVRLLDAVDRRSTIDAIARRLGRPEADVAAALAALGPGLVAVEASPVAIPVAPAPAPVAAGAEAPRRTRVLDRLRRSSRWAQPVRPTIPTAAERAAVTPVAPEASRPHPVAPASTPPQAAPDGRIPVYAIWHDTVGPSLSLGMLTAAARAHRGGALQDTFDIRRPERAEEFLADLAGRRGPAILLLSDYVWSLDDNLDAALRALRVNPELFVLHGGPSSPKYPGDAEQFLRAHAAVAHVLVRGEGEHVLCAVLDALAEDPTDLRTDRLVGVAGLSFLDARGDLVRTPDQERIADLDALPSPYLTGEFDHIDNDSWQHCLSIETNRGCPYGCTFCDWGSSTLSRIRKFGMERIEAELRWAAARQIWSLNVSDANFGIMSRDVEIARTIAAVKEADGFPRLVSYYPAKNTTKHLAPIMDLLIDAGIGPAATLSLQTTDEETLAAIERSNISTDHYVALTAEFRRRDLPLQGDLLIGLPGQTFASYRTDLQYHIDHEVAARTWQVRILPNAPMNAPEYRLRHGVETDDAHRIMATTSFDADERARMLRLRTVDVIAERFGLLRHVMRHLQWDHGVPATTLEERILDLVDHEPDRFPTISWVFLHFDLFHVVAEGWGAFYGEVAQLLQEEFGVGPDPATDAVLRLQRFLMPAPGRTFPATIELAHDYLAHYLDATAELHRSGHAGVPEVPLSARGPATFTILGDPLELCTEGLSFDGDPRDELFENDFVIGANSAYELASPLMRLLPHVAFVARDEYHRAHPPHPAAAEPRPEATPAPRVPDGAYAAAVSIGRKGGTPDRA